jgi:hypothetical protein
VPDRRGEATKLIRAAFVLSYKNSSRLKSQVLRQGLEGSDSDVKKFWRSMHEEYRESWKVLVRIPVQPLHQLAA